MSSSFQEEKETISSSFQAEKETISSSFQAEKEKENEKKGEDEFLIESLELDFKRWFTNDYKKLKYFVKIDLTLLNEPIKFWDSIVSTYMKMKIIKDIIGQGYKVNIVDNWEHRSLIIDVITDVHMIKNFNLDNEINMKDILLHIEAHNFKYGPLYIDLEYKTSDGFIVKNKPLDIYNEVDEEYNFRVLKDKIAITKPCYESSSS